MTSWWYLANWGDTFTGTKNDNKGYKNVLPLHYLDTEERTFDNQGTPVTIPVIKLSDLINADMDDATQLFGISIKASALSALGTPPPANVWFAMVYDKQKVGEAPDVYESVVRVVEYGNFTFDLTYDNQLQTYRMKEPVSAIDTEFPVLSDFASGAYGKDFVQDRVVVDDHGDIRNVRIIMYYSNTGEYNDAVPYSYPLNRDADIEWNTPEVYLQADFLT